MRRPPLVLAAAAAALAGCGGDDGGRGSAVTVAPDRPLTVAARDYSFDPSSIAVRGTGSGARTIRFVVRNSGAQAHDLRVERDGQELGGTPVFGPGQTERATVALVRGRYTFVCSVGDHAELGMKGELTVR